MRVIHVHEATKPGAELYVMGPKEIFGEYVDGQLASKAAAARASAYDGAVIPSLGEGGRTVTGHAPPAGQGGPQAPVGAY